MVKANVANAASVLSRYMAIITSLEHQAPDYIRVEASAFPVTNTELSG